jgi:hypothetical protein
MQQINVNSSRILAKGAYFSSKKDDDSTCLLSISSLNNRLLL